MKKIKAYAFTLFATYVVLMLSLFPVPEIPELEDVPMSDKWAHFIMYGAYSIAFWIDILRNKKYHKDKITKGKQFYFPCLLSLIIPSAIGGAIEIIQPLVGRSCELLDFYADVIGASLGTVIMLLFSIFYRDCK